MVVNSSEKHFLALLPNPVSSAYLRAYLTILMMTITSELVFLPMDVINQYGVGHISKIKPLYRILR